MNRTRKITALLILGAVLLAVLASALYSKKDAPPKFFVREKKVDLGDFFEGADIVHTFVVRNMGEGELQILNVRPG